VAGRFLAVLVGTAGLHDLQDTAVIGAGDDLPLLAPTLPSDADIRQAVTVQAELILLAVAGLEALDAHPGVQVAEHVVVFAVLVGCARHNPVAEVVGTTGFPFVAVAFLHAHHALAQGLLTDQLAGAVLRRCARR